MRPTPPAARKAGAALAVLMLSTPPGSVPARRLHRRRTIHHCNRIHRIHRSDQRPHQRLHHQPRRRLWQLHRDRDAHLCTRQFHYRPYRRLPG